MEDEEPADDLLERARAWAAEDPDPSTRAELEDLLARAEDGDARAATDLADRFAGRLEFGTAGLRGPIGAGPMRMNVAVVVRAAAGLVAYLRDQGVPPGAPVAIGFDARHRSADFAAATAEVVEGAGFRALVLPAPLPTPVLAFAIRRLDCAAGVMVTASHNPPADNGYKVYLGTGSQIVPPADREISERIDAIRSLADVPRGEGAETLSEAVVEAYLDRLVSLVPSDKASRAARADLTVVHTSLHGVGGGVVREALARAGFAEPHVVAEQAEPDPDFPTVAFPNPEEPGAMDLALALASEVCADLVVANDPDADRCAAGVPTPAGWRMLSGDEVGALLAEHLLASGLRATVATTVVSSSQLAAIAAHHGVEHATTLTGFKWLATVPDLGFAYEEALGYCCDPEAVRDKDGVSALLLLADLAAAERAKGRTLVDALDDLAVRHGLHATDQLSVRVDDVAVIAAAMSRLRESPPAVLAGLAVESFEDLRDGLGGPDGLPPTDGVRLRLADHARVVVRPSGTEPKLKAYLEVVVPVEQPHEDRAGAVQAARIAAAGRLDALRSDLAAALGL